jgi:membrane-associated protease RseP (regulator of RpoE activity)
LRHVSALKGPTGQVRTYSTGPFRALADNARAAEWSAIRPEDQGRLFYEKPFWQKLIIMASGPTMNILLAFLILLGVSVSYGVYRSQLTISKVRNALSSRTPPIRVALGNRRRRLRSRVSSLATRSSRSTEPGLFLGRRLSSDSIEFDHPALLSVERAGQRIDLKPVNTVITGVPDRYDHRGASRRVLWC